MARELLHLYGPFSVNSYGVAIAIGLVVFSLLSLGHPLRKRIISQDNFTSTLLFGILVGIVGGRLLYVMNAWHFLDSPLEVFQIWDGGFALLGSIIAILATLPWYLRSIGVPILPFFDLVALHAPLLEAIARLGCFAAGCCYGKATNLAWAVIYTNPDSAAPLNCSLHPTQIYTSLFSLCIFLFLYFGAQKKLQQPGQLLYLYLMLVGIERFCIDFLRGDREFFSSPSLQMLSVYQWIALALFSLAFWSFLVVSHKKKE